LDISVLGFVGLAILIAVLLVVQRKALRSGKHGRPVDEAEVCLAYGRKKEAVEILEAHLKEQAGDLKAKRLLDSIK
jgi:hypothetical protein